MVESPTIDEDWRNEARKVLAGDYDIITVRTRRPPDGSLRTALVIGMRGLASRGDETALKALSYMGLTLIQAQRE